MQRPKPTAGLHHIALYIKQFAECEYFYTQLLGMKVDWRPDADNLYLTSGNDNLALHRAPANFIPTKPQRLDHIGFFLNEREEVDTWHTFLSAHQVKIKAPPKDHRDGTRSFYCSDPDGNTVQMIYIPSEKLNKIKY
ncbi:MAG: fosB [Gammaproteobacteria bacterium]|jgi:catechol 2,3-dioxygenase-like lactoylglutathione lyase family enzyme|nr:fosB [Gammaproteobacteria bacterium]